MYTTFQQTFVYILYAKCIQNVCKMFVYKIYPVFRQTFVSKCMQNVCIQNVYYNLTIFCIHFVYKT